jgi:hypothetical protein
MLIAKRWFDLSPHRRLYPLYELIDRPTGTAVYRDPFTALRRTARMCKEFPGFGSAIRRVSVHGFYTADTVSIVYESLKECGSLTSLSCSWTAIRYLSRDSWQMLLTGRRVRLESLELQCVEPTIQQIADKTNWVDLDPLWSVDFSCLHRLKIFGNTTHMPVTDSDVLAITSTATALREFYLTCNSSTTIDSVVAVAEAASATLRVLEHSPRSRDGFWHSHPGSPHGAGQHYCAMFRKTSRLKTLSVSLPTVCADFFSDESSRFMGTLQVRAFHICEHESSRWTADTTAALRDLLHQARGLIERCSRNTRQDPLFVEVFFAGFIFEPGTQSVHGDFSAMKRRSAGRWSPNAVPSSKGPYGRSGLYDANEELSFERISEEDFLRANQWLCVL